MTTRVLFRTQFLEGSSDQVVALSLRALPGLRSLPCVRAVSVHLDRNAPDVLWGIWEFASDEDMFALYQEPLYTRFLTEMRPFVSEHGVQTHVLAEVDAAPSSSGSGG